MFALTRKTSVPSALTLSIKPAPLPQGIEFHVAASGGGEGVEFGVRIGGLGTLCLQGQGDFATVSGLQPHFETLLLIAAQHDAWGKSVVCTAHVLKKPGHPQVLETPKSNPCALTLPVRILYPTTQLTSHYLAWGDPVSPVKLAPPSGRRIYWYSTGGLLSGSQAQAGYRGLFVGPGNMPETAANARGYDRYSFWLSVFGAPIRSTCSIATGESLAQKLNGTKPPDPIPMYGSLESIVQAAGPMCHKLKDCILWTPTRVIVVRTGVQEGAMEWGSQGLSIVPAENLVNQNSPGEFWNVRKLNPVFMAGRQSLEW